MSFRSSYVAYNAGLITVNATLVSRGFSSCNYPDTSIIATAFSLVPTEQVERELLNLTTPLERNTPQKLSYEANHPHNQSHTHVYSRHNPINKWLNNNMVL
ncbi:hypothetical protein ABHI18_006516 [Aspergillus niger]